MIARYEQRREKREALNMVPMCMGEQNCGGNWSFCIRNHLVTQQPRARAAIQNQIFTVMGRQLNAGCVAAVMIGAGARRRDRSSSTPEAQTHSDCRRTVYRVNQQSLQSSAARSLPDGCSRRCRMARYAPAPEKSGFVAPVEHPGSDPERACRVKISPRQLHKGSSEEPGLG